MADPAIGFDRGVDPTAYNPYVGGERVANDRSQRPQQPGDQADAHRQDLAALIKIATARLEEGADAEATESFRRALEIGDRTLGPDNPDLVLLLNDLTRLYLKQSMYAEAEPLLLRLRDIKRAKGEDHPEVATVLASLATVHQALGRHESAEQLWRRVLEIREHTLAPNHFAIATALEHLGDACAARGNIREALPAFKRALTIRECTLGSAHPSLRVSRERIGDLQLQSAEETLDPSPESGSPAPERYRLISGDYLRLNAPGTATGQAVTPMLKDMSPLSQVSRKARATMHYAASEPVAPEVPPVRDEAAAGSAPAIPAALTAYRDVLESMREELEDTQEPEAIGAKLTALLQSLTSFLGKRQVVAGIIVIVVALLFLAVAKDRALGEFDQTADGTIAPRTLPNLSTPATSASALSIPVRAPVNAVATPSSAKPAASRPRAEDHTPSKRAEESKPETKRLSLPTVAKSVLSNLDALASKAASVSAPDPLAVQPAAIAVSTPRTSFESSSDQSNAPVRARLIGELPTPRVPTQVADVEGDVRVRFNVDAQGVPVMSTFSVVTSPNPLLTAAVRRVIPSMRFEPARTGGSDPKPITDVVETGFRFARASR